MKSLKQTVRWIFVLGIFPLLMFSPVPDVNAEMQPARIAVNHDIRQCAKFTCGDECADCRLPEGWQVLGYAFNVTCPADYEIVEIETVWVPIASEFCCTPGHSGSPGNCSDLIKNQISGRCSFGKDVRQRCGSLLFGWMHYGRECSSWMDEEISCQPAFLPLFPGSLTVFLCLGILILLGVVVFLFWKKFPTRVNG